MSSRPRGPYRPGHYQAPQSPAHPQKPEHAKRDRYDWATLWIAAIGVFIVAVSAVIQAWQVVATRRQLEMMATQQRPWVAVDPPRDVQLSLLKHDKDRGVSLIVLYDLPLKNAGEVAAIDVVVTSRVIGNDPIEGGDLVTPEVTKLCAEPDPDPGRAVFPGEVATEDGADMTDVGGTKGLFHLVNGESLITPIIIGCVTYKSAVDGLTKHTPFAFEIIDKAWKTNARKDWRYMTAVPYRQGAPVDVRRSRYGGTAAD